MKKIVSLILALVLLSVCAFAVAEEATASRYDTTKAFMEQMDQEQIMYTVLGRSDDGYDQIRVNYSGDNTQLISVNCFFTPDNVTASLCVWGVISYDPAKTADVMAVCNTLNNDYKYVRYSCDASDNTVTAQFDTVLLPDTAGPVCTTMVSLMVASIDEAYTKLAPFALAQ